MSLPERMLWRLLRGRPDGFKFRRQHSAGIYILDFYCPSVRLAIEVDGRKHDGEQATTPESARSTFLISKHIATLRVPAKALMPILETASDRIDAMCEYQAGKLRITKEK